MTGSRSWTQQGKVLAWGVLAWGLAYWLLRLLGTFSDSPWRVAVVLVPLAVVVVVLGYPLWRQRRLVLGGGFLVFFAAYCMLFAIADGTELLSGRRQVLTGYEDATPRSFFGLTGLADWHYWVVPKGPEVTDLVIVTLPSFEGRTNVEARRELAALVAVASRYDAKAIAFDYYLDDESAADRILCHAVRGARERGIAVFFGTHLEERGGSLFRHPVPASLECLDDESLASLAGYMESDDHVRMVPTSQPGDEEMPALSVRVALALEPGLNAPPRLVQFVAPKSGVPVLKGPLSDVSDEEVSLLAGKVVLVGSSREGDKYETPFGRHTGVEIHAFAAHSLASGHFIRRLDRFWIFPVLFGLCYVLTLVQASGGGVRTLLAAAGVLSVAVIAAAALAMRELVWIDAAYPLAAMWCLVLLLYGGAALQRGRSQAHGAARADGDDEPVADQEEPFDVFLAHNGVDKPAVRRLADALRDRGLHPWLDEEQLRPGQRWGPALETAINTARSAAVIVGEDGLGPWEKVEMWGCLEQSVKRKMPVLPVLLPGDYEQPELPLFLSQFHWTDCRDGLTEEKLDDLQWGITLIKPSRRRPPRT